MKARFPAYISKTNQILRCTTLILNRITVKDIQCGDFGDFVTNSTNVKNVDYTQISDRYTIMLN